MPRRRKSGRLNVFLNSRLVGRLNREASGAIDFRYHPEWLAWEHTLPVSLSLPLREDRYVGAPVSAVFDNLLPDDEGIRRNIAVRVGADGTDPFSLLSALGRDCVGALQFLPDDVDPGPAGIIAGHPVKNSEIAGLIANLARNPLGLERDDDFRISLAGVQEKTALLRYQGRWQKPVGATPTTHILKPQIGELPNGIDLSNSVENEYLCLALTKAFGLPSAHAEMSSFGDLRVLIVERFDRLFTRDGRLLRIPQEDCCQSLSVPWARKYESEGGPGVAQILRLLAATDGHGKNFSVQLSPGGGFRLAPLYDVVSAQPALDAGQIRRNKLKMAMAVGDGRHYAVERIAGRHFVESAFTAGMGKPVALGVIGEVIDTAPRAVDAVMSMLPKGFPESIAASIDRGVRARVGQLAREREHACGE